MGLTQEIIFFLSNNPGSYKKLRQRLSGNIYLSNLEEGRRNKKLYDTFYHLKRRGLIENNGEIWKISEKYKNRLKSPEQLRKINFNPIAKSSGQFLIMFDIPENKRRDREWLRRKLKQINFIMVQQSVWLGPAPLPKGFTPALKELKIMNHLKFFRVKEKRLI